jgi:regulator of protease activity HflC (stomatin/prohibitin superfamily)
MALKYNWVWMTISEDVIRSPGWRFVGPFNDVIRYPKTLQNIEYDSSHFELMDGRTKDGLPIILAVAFQYRLKPQELVQLYMDYEQTYGAYKKIFELVGMHEITEEATRHSAYEFFTEKQSIADIMKTRLNDYFSANLHAEVLSLQILENDLPSLFRDTIIAAGRKKQMIMQMQKTRDAKMVEFQTQRKVARAQANVTIQKAVGERSRILQDAKAESFAIGAYVDAELESYGQVNHDLGLEGDGLVKYIWYDTLAGGGVEQASVGEGSNQMSMFMGVSPSAYISEFKA